MPTLATETSAVRATGVARRKKPVRIAFCIDGMGIGGTELNAIRTAERLDRSRFDVSVICLRADGPLLARYREQGIPVLHLPIERLHSVAALRQGIRLARYLRAQRIDIVHSHDIYNNIFAATWARMAGTPVVIASRRWWEDFPRKALGVVNRYAYRLAHCVIANSPRVADLLVDDEGVDAGRVAIIPNFVDDAAFERPPHAASLQLIDELRIPPEALVVGCIAGLRPVKDHGTLIRAIAKIRPRWPELRLVLVGEGDARESLERLVQELNVAEIVRFAGARPNEPNLHHLFDVSALTSVGEAFPNSIVEAMAAGRPVVATRVGGVMDAVIDGKTGCLVASRDVDALANAIDRLLAHPELRRTMGSAGQRRARDCFHASSVLSTLETLYDRLLMARAG